MYNRNTGRFDGHGSNMYPSQSGWQTATDFNGPDDAKVYSPYTTEMERTESGETSTSYNTNMTGDTSVSYHTSLTGDSCYYSLPTVDDNNCGSQNDDRWDDAWMYGTADAAAGPSQMYSSGEVMQQPPAQQDWITGVGSQYADQYASQQVVQGRGSRRQQGRAAATTPVEYNLLSETINTGSWVPPQGGVPSTTAAMPYIIPPGYGRSGGDQEYVSLPYLGVSDGGQTYSVYPASAPLASPSVTTNSGGQWRHSNLAYDISPSLTSMTIDADNVPASAPSSSRAASSSASSSATAQAARVSASTSTRPNQYQCLWPGCGARAFGRPADLDRHQKNTHLQDGSFTCDYPRCSRHRRPFGRQDHFRDHLREFHKEDLPRRGQEESRTWWAERARRSVYEGWWRCNRCLRRVVFEENQYVCPGQTCGAHCETERQIVRGLPVACDHEGCENLPVFHRHDLLREHLRYFHGEDLPLPGQTREPGGDVRDLDSAEWWNTRTLYSGWWRCNRCLGRVDQDGPTGWQCPRCLNPCEEERIAVRTNTF